MVCCEIPSKRSSESTGWNHETSLNVGVQESRCTVARMAKLSSHPDVGSHTLRGRNNKRGSRRVRERKDKIESVMIHIFYLCWHCPRRYDVRTYRYILTVSQRKGGLQYLICVFTISLSLTLLLKKIQLVKYYFL